MKPCRDGSSLCWDSLKLALQMQTKAWRHSLNAVHRPCCKVLVPSDELWSIKHPYLWVLCNSRQNLTSMLRNVITYSESW